MAQLPSYAEVLTKDPDGSDPNDYSGKVKYLPRWPKIHPDYKPEHLNKPEHQWIFGHPVMILSRGPSDKGNVDVCVLRTFQGRGLQAEHGDSLQSRFYLLIHPEPPHRHPTGHPFIVHPFTGPPTIPVLYLINPEYRILEKSWVNLRRTYTLPYHSLEDFKWSDNRTIPTLMRTSYWQMVGYQRSVVPELRLLEEVEMDEASSISVGSEASSTGISSGTVSSDGSSSKGLSSLGSSSQGFYLEGSSVEGSSTDAPPPDGSSSECPTSECRISDDPPP